MRHRKSGRKFGMDPSARKAMLRNMVTSLMRHGAIRTTEARAKELRSYAEKVITMAKRAPSAAEIDSMQGADADAAKAQRVHAIRQARLWVNDKDVLGKVFGEYRDRFADRSGGYTRVVKAGYRDGDNAAMAIIELVGESADPVEMSDDAEVGEE